MFLSIFNWKDVNQMSSQNKAISLQSIIGKGYYDFWNSRATYVVVKGSRASKKSKTTALW